MSSSRVRRIGAWWGIIGVIAILTFAIIRLTPFSLEALREPLSGLQWVIVISWSIFMIISEGYDGFYKRIAPRIIIRARELREKGTYVQLLLAPLYCLNYFAAEKKRMIVAYTAIGTIIVAVMLVHQLAQPWRGIIDTGVVAGLLAGCIGIIIRTRQS